MALYKYPSVDELLPSDEELRKQREAASASGQDSSWGSAIGSALGGIGGGILGSIIEPGGGTLVGAGLGASVGGGLGGAIGGSIGNATAQGDNNYLDQAQLARNKKVQELQLRNQALNDLLNTA